MNLHQIARNAINMVNPDVYGDVYISTGYTVLPNGKQVPQYDIQTGIRMQMQALTTKDIRQLDNVNVGGSTNSVYINGRLDGLMRTENKGGDLLVIAEKTWKVTGVLERWPDWTKVAVTLQKDPP